MHFFPHVHRLRFQFLRRNSMFEFRRTYWFFFRITATGFFHPTQFDMQRDSALQLRLKIDENAEIERRSGAPLTLMLYLKHEKYRFECERDLWWMARKRMCNQRLLLLLQLDLCTQMWQQAQWAHSPKMYTSIEFKADKPDSGCIHVGRTSVRFVNWWSSFRTTGH